MLQPYYIGCSGWSYDGWLGHFYPSSLEKNKFLEYYGRVFDFVEIDSSFYNTPNLFVAKRWAKVTPDNFRFTAKMPRSITHEKRLGSESEKDLRYFFQMLQPLKNKILALLIQLPPSLTAKEGIKKLESLIHMLDPNFRHAIEVTSTGGTSFRYDTRAGQFVYNWQTPKAGAGSCYDVTFTTLDGSSLTAHFKLK